MALYAHFIKRLSILNDVELDKRIRSNVYQKVEDEKINGMI